MTASPEQAEEFATAFRAFLEWIHQPADALRNEVVALVRGHLGAEGGDTSVVTRALPVFDHVNLQVALDAWIAQPGRQVRIEGLVVPQHHDTPELQQLLRGIEQLIVRPGPPALIDLANGPASTLACLQTALLLVTDARGRYVLLVRGPERHRQPSLTVDIAGLPVEQAQQVHNELASLRSQLNVYRGRVLELEPSDMGGVRLSFVTLPPTARADVVLPEAVLRRIERHTVDIAGHREQLRSAGQHLKRGLLLFGPPGTGKTHTTRYVVGQMAGSTVLMLSGRSLGAIGAIAGLARELAPAVIVLEDVDLVAEDRGYGPGSNPVLFELLDAMDGAAADADLLFLLTTNRADLLEPALAARPGRVDVAVQIGLPDAAARTRLFQLYSRGVPLELAESDVAEVVRWTAGTTASLIKELIRRSVLEALTRSPELTGVTATDVRRALDDLLDSNDTVTRALLGVGDPGSHPQPPRSATPAAAPPDLLSGHQTDRAAGGHGGTWVTTLNSGPGSRPVSEIPELRARIAEARRVLDEIEREHSEWQNRWYARTEDNKREIYRSRPVHYIDDRADVLGEIAHLNILLDVSLYEQTTPTYADHCRPAFAMSYDEI